MYARVTLCEIDVVRADVDELLDRYRHEVLPGLQEQPGYEGTLVLVNDDGQGLLVSLWADEEAMEATAPLASGAIERFLTVFRAPPGRESYAVRLADVPALAID